jgi:hypothetical protein
MVFSWSLDRSFLYLSTAYIHLPGLELGSILTPGSGNQTPARGGAGGGSLRQLWGKETAQLEMELRGSGRGWSSSSCSSSSCLLAPTHPAQSSSGTSVPASSFFSLCPSQCAVSVSPSVSPSLRFCPCYCILVPSICVCLH